MSENMRPSASARLPRTVVSRLNEAFYEGAPHHYFEQRLVNLVAAAEHEAEPVELPVGKVLDDALGRESEFDPAALDGAARGLYVAAESQVLLHHVAESLIRLIFGHLGSPPCPWVEISSPTKFKKWVEHQIVAVQAEQLRNTLRPVLLGIEEPRTDRSEALLDSSVAIVKSLADRFLQDAPLYNTAKHGFAVNAGRQLLQICLDTDGMDDQERAAARELGESFTFKGVTLQCLEWEHDPATGQREWYQADRFVEVPYDMALIYLAVRVMANLWAIARTRYTGGGEAVLQPLDGLTPAEVRQRTHAQHGTFRRPVNAVTLPQDEAHRVMDRFHSDQDGGPRSSE